jgi:CheY-like chemotaxis protein
MFSDFLLRSARTPPADLADEQICHRVMIVENCALLTFLMEEVMRSFGHRTAGTFSNAADAVGKMEQLRPDIVLSEVRLDDGRGGYRVAAEASRLHIPCLFVTALAPDEEEAGAISAGYLLKPFPTQDLRWAIRVVGGDHQPWRRLSPRVRFYN